MSSDQLPRTKAEEQTSQKHGQLSKCSGFPETASLVSMERRSRADSRTSCVLGDTRSSEILTTDVTVATVAVPDGGWGWLLVVVCFLSCCIHGFVIAGFAVLYVEFVEYFEANKGVTGWIGSLFLFSGNIIGIVIGSLIKRFGCRAVAMAGTIIGAVGLVMSSFLISIGYLCFTYGFLGGVGCTLIYMANLVILQQYFDKRRTLATGMGTAGLSFGGLSSAPLTNYLINKYGLSGSFYIFAGMWLQCAVFASFYRPLTASTQTRVEISKISKISKTTESKPQQNIKQQPTSSFFRDVIDFSVLSNPRLLLFLIGTFLFNIGSQGFLTHYLSRALYLGLDRELAIRFQMSIYIATASSRFIFSVAGNCRGFDRVLGYSALGVGCGITVLSFPMATTPIPLLIYACAFGLCLGGFFTVQPATLVDLAGVTEIAKLTGILHMVLACALIAGTPLTGFIFDVSRSYDLPYFVIGSVHLCGGATLTALSILQKTKWRKTKEDQ